MKVKTLVVMAVSSLLAVSFACANASITGRLVDDMSTQSPSGDATANPGAMENNGASTNPGAVNNMPAGTSDSAANPTSGSGDEDTQDTATGDSEGDY